MGGGSLSNLPKINDRTFFENAAKMELLHTKNADSQEYVLGKKGMGYILFSESGKLKIDLSDDKNNYTIKWINPSTGEITLSKKNISGGRTSSVESTFDVPVVAWLIKK